MKPITTRYSLLSRLKNWDDQESWRDFFDTYWRLIYGIALKAGLTEAEAQDVVQETVITVAKGIDKFKKDRAMGSFKAWLRNIIRWRIADQFRKRLPEAKPPVVSEQKPQNLEEIIDPQTDVIGKEWEEEWQENLFQAAVERVKVKVKAEHYQIFDLYVMKSWPVSKIARHIGVNVGQVYLAKHRVFRLIKKEVARLQKSPFEK
jgi:RNA polymerase sigma-70 factor (ECF subfamily)